MRQPARAFSENQYFSSTLVHKQETCEVSRGENQQFVRIRTLVPTWSSEHFLSVGQNLETVLMKLLK